MCTKSSLPFILDDPKSPDDVGELLISIYDGGNLRKGLRRPRSIPLFFYELNSEVTYSITIRDFLLQGETLMPVNFFEGGLPPPPPPHTHAGIVLIIPFLSPTIGPCNKDETMHFLQLTERCIQCCGMGYQFGVKTTYSAK
jgi:hypothetical protein